MAKGDELKFERSPATEAKREQGNQRGKNDNSADDGMVAALLMAILCRRSGFEQPQFASARRLRARRTQTATALGPEPSAGFHHMQELTPATARSDGAGRRVCTVLLEFGNIGDAEGRRGPSGRIVRLGRCSTMRWSGVSLVNDR